MRRRRLVSAPCWPALYAAVLLGSVGGGVWRRTSWRVDAGDSEALAARGEGRVAGVEIEGSAADSPTCRGAEGDTLSKVEGISLTAEDYVDAGCRVQPWLSRREEAREMFTHAWRAYLDHAHPWDELKPLSCEPRRWDKRSRGTLDDSLGGFMTTAVDSLDTLALMGDYDEFRRMVREVVRHLSFDRDVTVSVFETNIRILGGLLSAHMLLEDDETAPLLRGNLNYNNVDAYLKADHAGDGLPHLSGNAIETNGGHRAEEIDSGTSENTGSEHSAGPVLGGFGADPLTYDGELLDLALDLGNRLLPAFRTRHGLPYHRVNLKYGVPKGETKETCVAAAGTLILEFGVLSRLSGVSSFETAARKSIRALWSRRSAKGLLGSNINIQSGKWTQTHSSVGAGSDSFYEYILKAYVLFGDPEFLEMFESMYKSLEEHLSYGPWKIEVDMNKGKGKKRSYYISSLGAFWPALQVLAGDIQHAEASHGAFHSIWKEFSSMPEIFDLANQKTINFGKDWPLRPELLESSYHLYVKTRDPHYLQVAEDIMHTLQNISRVDCGFASIADVNTHRLDDRMDSYFFAETLKYLWLIFDEASRHPPGGFPGDHDAFRASLRHNATRATNNRIAASAKLHKRGEKQKAAKMAEDLYRSAAKIDPRNGKDSRAAVEKRALLAEKRKEKRKRLKSKAPCSLDAHAQDNRYTSAAMASGQEEALENDAVDDLNLLEEIVTMCPSRLHMHPLRMKSLPLLDLERSVFTTEGHIFPLWPSLRSRNHRSLERSSGRQSSKKPTGARAENRRRMVEAQSKATAEQKEKRQKKKEAEMGRKAAEHKSEEEEKMQVLARVREPNDHGDDDETFEDEDTWSEEMDTSSQHASTQTGAGLNSPLKIAPPRNDLSASHRLGLDALASSLGAHYARNGLGAAFNIECDYNGICTISQRLSLGDTEQFRQKWDYVDIDFFFSSSPTSDSTADSSQQKCFQVASKGASEEKKEGIRFSNRKLDGSPNEAAQKISDAVLASRRRHLNVASIEADLPNGTSFYAGHFHVVGSPAMFGTPIPSFDAFTTEAVRQENHSFYSASSDSAAADNMAINNIEIDVDVLVANLTMVSPFYYGCQDPLDLDPSLEGMLLKVSAGVEEQADAVTPEVGVILFRGECSFVAKVCSTCDYCRETCLYNFRF